MKIVNPCKRQCTGSIILPMLASDTVHHHLIEVLTTRSLTVWLCTSKKCSGGLPARARTPHSTISSGQRPSGLTAGKA